MLSICTDERIEPVRFSADVRAPGLRVEHGLHEEQGGLALDALELDDQRVRQPHALAVQLVAPCLEPLRPLQMHAHEHTVLFYI